MSASFVRRLAAGRLLFVFLAGFGLILRGDDLSETGLVPPPSLLANGDFADGLANWEGAVKPPPDNPDGTAGTGAGISLQREEWSLATHDFELHPGRYTLQIIFKILPNTQFAKDMPDYMNLREKLGIFDAEHYLEAQPGQWIAAVIDTSNQKYLWWPVKPTAAAGNQSYSFTIANINFEDKQRLLLAFPPGDGKIVLQRVSIVAVSNNHP